MIFQGFLFYMSFRGAALFFIEFQFVRLFIAKYLISVRIIIAFRVSSLGSF